MGAKLHLTEKVAEFIGSGITLAFTRDKRMRKKMHAICDEVWYSIDRKQLYQALDRLQLQGVVKIIKDNDGIERVKLTRPIAAYSLQKRINELEIKKPRKWDKKWRIVMFDIPEEKRVIRNALRRKLQQLGFIEFQKSVFVHPFSCRDEINLTINFFNISENVFYIEANIQPDAVLRKRFEL